MNCEILRTLYLRANGEIPCNCAAGERINLGWSLGEPGWDISRIFENDNYTAIRESFAANKTPWGSVCEQCAFWVPKEPMDDQLRQNRWIEKFQVEPALTCALKCPGCSRADQIKRRKPPFVLDESIFKSTLESLRSNLYRIGFFYYCGQGEPLNHPRFQDLAVMANEYYPDCRQVVNTNGNHLVSRVFDEGRYVPGEFIVSVDGLYQSNYEKYRINGDVELALRFMKDLKSLEKAPIVEWKYILFTYNDSDEEILSAQRKAMELGVDRVIFVLTHSRERSLRFSTENLDELPLMPGIGHHMFTPHLAHKKEVARLVERSKDPEPNVAILDVESVARSRSGVVVIQAVLRLVESIGLDTMEVQINGTAVGQVSLSGTRTGCGSFPFSVTKKSQELLVDDYVIEFSLRDRLGRVLSNWSCRYSFDEAEIHKHTSSAR